MSLRARRPRRRGRARSRRAPERTSRLGTGPSSRWCSASRSRPSGTPRPTPAPGRAPRRPRTDTGSRRRDEVRPLRAPHPPRPRPVRRPPSARARRAARAPSTAPARRRRSGVVPHPLERAPSEPAPIRAPRSAPRPRSPRSASAPRRRRPRARSRRSPTSPPRPARAGVPSPRPSRRRRRPGGRQGRRAARPSPTPPARARRPGGRCPGRADAARSRRSRQRRARGCTSTSSAGPASGTVGPSNRPSAAWSSRISMLGFARTMGSSSRIASSVGPGGTREPMGNRSHRVTRSPPVAASSAADRPAVPAPTTTASHRTCLETVRVIGASTGSGPEPVVRRISRSATGQANRGRMKVFVRNPTGMSGCRKSAACSRSCSADGQPRSRRTRIPLRGGGDAGADARNAVDRDRAVRALAGPAVQAAATVRLQRPRERAHAGPEERGCDGVAFEDRDLAPFEPQRLPRHPIRFVLVSRVTVNHVRHPNAWNQRSRCGPSAFSGTRTRGRAVPASRGTWGRSSPPNANSVCGREPQFGQGTSSVTSAAASGPSGPRATPRSRAPRSHRHPDACRRRTGTSRRPASGTATTPAAAA